MIIIGEKINATRKKVAQAIKERDASAIASLVRDQDEAGADVIDLNAGTGQGGMDQTVENMKWLIEIALQNSSKPLALDSESPEVIEAAMPFVSGETPWINSVSAEKDRLETVMQLVKEYGSPVVALCLDDSGMPKDMDSRLKAAEAIYNAAQKASVPPESLWFDPLIMPLATDTKAGMNAVEAIREIKTRFPGVKTVAGLSNISFGLPARATVNASFLILCMAAGLDAAILDPNNDNLMMAYRSANALLGNDSFCMEYISLFRSLKKD